MRACSRRSPNSLLATYARPDLLAILDRAKADGKLRTANVLLAGLKQIFRFALARDIVEKNPLDTVTKRDAGGAETGRERVLRADATETPARWRTSARRLRGSRAWGNAA